MINNLLMSLAEEQIKAAFAQSEKEVQDLHTRISQGMRESKRSGKSIGLAKGTTLVTAKSVQCKEIIKKHATDFGGTLSDPEVMTLCKISRNSYYKYKRELKMQREPKGAGILQCRTQSLGALVAFVRIDCGAFADNPTGPSRSNCHTGVFACQHNII